MRSFGPLLVLNAIYHVIADPSYATYRIPEGVPDKSSVSTKTGVALIGGGADCIPAFDWMIDHANGGDFLILRASGTDAYNDFVYDLSVTNNQTLNSVTTIVFSDRSASSDPAVLKMVEDAEVIFFAGGDQGLYLSLWADTPLQDLLNKKLLQVTIGGTSAGLAIQGNWVYSAVNGSGYSDESLENPYNRYITIADRFLQIPFMDFTLTDTHFHARDRMGRMLSMISRVQADIVKGSHTVHGIGVDEVTALLLDINSGDVEVVGSNHAYLCDALSVPQVCAPATPLTFLSIPCTRLSSGDRYSFSTWQGDGMKYKNVIVGGKYASSSYGPSRK